MPVEVDVTVPLPGLSPVPGKPIIARFEGGSLSSDCGLLALREVTDILRFRMLMTIAHCENANFCDMKGLELPMAPPSSLLLVSDRRGPPLLIRPFRRKRLHQPRQRHLLRLPPIQDRLDDVRGQ